MSYAIARRHQDNTVPVLLELGGGFFFQTFGVGHIAQGRVATGVTIMFSYWALQFVNALLCMVLIGLVTAPLTWLAYMIAAPMNVVNPD
jgi:TM2 domain-containing membrane protein YozV